MEPREEYHDPDYPGTAAPVQEVARVLSDEEKIEKIKSIIRREFSNELETRENEVMLIEQRMSTSRRMLHRLRYAIVNTYYNEQKLQLTNSQIDDDVAAQHEPRARAEVASMLRDGQRRLHPSVRKLLGKQTADLAEIFKTRAPRNKTRKDYSAMVQTRNYTIAADATKSLRPVAPDAAEPPEAPREPDSAPGTSGGKPRKVPRHLDPRQEKVLTIDEATRNKMKHRYRLIVGNTSKYAPPASRADRSTHKWLLYVRGPPQHPDPSPVLTHVVARLHHSYAPHHTVHVYKPPFHISRRGWGEFPAKVELHFPLPAVNRPAAVEHTIKLDRNYTGLQTLGSETVVEVWLYSTPEMLPFEYTDPVPRPPVTDASDTGAPVTDAAEPLQPKEEPEEYDSHDQSESWMEFFSKDTTELDVDEMIIKPVKKELVEEKSDIECEMNDINSFNDKDETRTEDWPDKKEQPDTFEETDTDITRPMTTLKRIMKYIDSTTGKIYYLEMDRNLDLTKVQEIVINNTKVKISPIKSNGLKNFRKKKGGVSLLKPEVKNQLRCDSKVRRNFTHIENDHCYLGNGWMQETSAAEKSDSGVVNIKQEVSHFDSLCSVMCRFTDVKMAVNYLLKKMPVITDRARDPDYVRSFPFVVESEERYWRLDFAKRRNIEWTRAKIINRLITEHLTVTQAPWRTKQILIYSRLHGFHPMRQETTHRAPDTDDWSSWNDLENSRKLESNIKEIYPNPADICSLTQFNVEEFLNSTLESVERSDSDEEVDVVGSERSVQVKTEAEVEGESPLTVLPVESEEDRLRFMFVERICADIGIELRNENVGNGYSYSAVHAVLLSAMKSCAEELVRGAAADSLLHGSEGTPPVWTSWAGAGVCAGAGGAWRAARGGRLRALGALALGAPRRHTAQPL